MTNIEIDVDEATLKVWEKAGLVRQVWEMTDLGNKAVADHVRRIIAASGGIGECYL